MMPLEKQVCSLELSQKLKALGVKQDGCFWWNWPPEEDVLSPYLCPRDECTTTNSWKRVSAFSVAELLGLLRELGKETVSIPLKPQEANVADYLARYVAHEKSKV